MRKESLSETRINKYLSERGLTSRRGADKAIERGEVIVNGKPAVLGQQITEDDEVRFKGKIVQKKRKKPVYLALNKPVGVVCTTDPAEPANIVDYMQYPERIFPIGRLDKDSEGLILLTNNGDIVNPILRERYGHEKEYEVTLDRPYDQDFIEKMESGVPILDTVTKPAKLKRTGAKTFKLTLTQGLNRQIRRMCEALGYEVVKLKRIRIMNVTLGNLPVGQYRELSPKEFAQMKGLLIRALKEAGVMDSHES